MARHPSVRILFMGGSTLDERPRRGSSVLTAKDVQAWLAQMGEMDVIASTTGVFIHGGLAAVGMTDWAATAAAIKKQYSQSDGFVVVHQVATLPAAAVALSLMLEKIGKPVVLAASPLVSPAERAAGWLPLVVPEIGRLGAKANFINALQVAVSDIGEVVVAVGHHLYRARSFIGPLDRPQAELIGKIDFGVRFFGAWRKRQASVPRLKNNFARRVAIVEFVPGLDPQYLVRLSAGSQGIFLSVPGSLSVPHEVLAQLAAAAKRTPILLNGKSSGLVPPSVIAVSGDRTCLLTRWLWALGQSRQPQTLRKLMTI